MLITSDNPWGGLWSLTLWVMIPLIVITVVVSVLRRRGSTAIAVTATRMLSGAFLGLICLGAIAGILTLLNARSVWLSEPLGGWVAGRRDLLMSPSCDADGTYPLDPDAPAANTTPFLCDTTVENVPFGPRLVIFIGTLLSLTAAAAIAWAIQVAAYRAEGGDFFHRSVARTFTASAVVALAAAALGQCVSGIGMTLAARSLEWSADAQPPFGLEIPLWPFAVTLGMFALAAIFRHGARLQRETEGLV